MYNQSIPNTRGDKTRAPIMPDAQPGPPNAGQSEAAVLSCFLKDDLSIALAVERFKLHPTDFFRAEHQAMCRTIYDEYQAGRAVDEITLGGALNRHNRLNIVGGLDAVAELVALNADATHIETYISDVKAAASKRFSWERSTQACKMSLNGAQPRAIQEVLEDTVREMRARDIENEDTKKARFTLISAQQFKKRPKPTFSVDNLLVDGGLSSVEGESESFKSFVAIAIAASIATGTPWCGRQVQQGSVVYISGEGSSGLSNRLRAWEDEHEMDLPDDFMLLPEAVQLMETGDIGLLFAAIEAARVKPRLVVIDTLARCMVGGDENSAQDMGLFVAGADAIRTKFGCGVLIVHHMNRSGKVRGSSAFMGAMDTRIEIDRMGDRIFVKCAKQKDFDHFSTFSLERKIRQLDDEGTTSLVFVPTNQPVEAAQNSSLETVWKVLNDSGKAMRTGEWEKAVAAHGIKRRTFYNLKDELLQQRRILAATGGFIALEKI